MKELYLNHIAGLMNLKVWQVENCADMFEEGDTIPFISRYRKEKTGVVHKSGCPFAPSAKPPALPSLGET